MARPSPTQRLLLPEGTDPRPTLTHEARLWAEGYGAVAGLDEAGRGALAGPVVAAAVVVPAGCALSGVWAAVRDSKRLSAAKRTALAAHIRVEAAAWAVGCAVAAEIDALGIAAATRLAMTRAVAGLATPPDYLLIDWVRLPTLSIPQFAVAKADSTMASVAAASILAKVTRDGILIELGERYPDYGFQDHKGYGARRHLAALEELGPCPEHRLRFAPLARRASLLVTETRHAG